MKVFLTPLLVLFLTVSGFAQRYELGRVTVDELKEKVHPKDSSAVAAILFQKGDVHFEYSGEHGFEMVTKCLVKIKIYKKEGYEWANHNVKFYTEGDAKESVLFDDAVTYNLVDGKIVKSRLKGDGEFEEKLNRYWSQKKITMPNVKEGSVIEFMYTIKTLNFGAIKKWDFQTSIPVNYSEFKTAIPQYFTYNVNQKGYLFPKVLKDGRERSIEYSYFEKTAPGLGTGAPERIRSTLNFREDIVIYQVQDMPALKDELFVNNIDNYTSSIVHELSVIKYPGENIRVLSTDWETVAKKIYDYDDFGPELNKKGYFENEVNAIISGLASKEEKIAAIFNFVKSKVKWNGYYGYSCNDGVKTAYKNQTGNVAEINLMLTAMLRHAGISANPVLLSTRSNGIAFFPNRNAFNYVIAAVEIENDLILLDATDKNSLPNILPVRDLNWFGRIIRKEGSSANVDLMPKVVSKGLTNALVSIDQQGKVSGKVREQYFDYAAYSFRNRFGELTKDAYLEKLEKEHNGIEIGEYESLNVKDLGKPVVENYSFNTTNSVEVIGDKMYFSPMLFFAWSKNPFTQENREYPVDFGYPTQDKFMINISIPEGYAIESVPESKAFSLPNGMGLFKINVAKTDKQIQLVLNRDINTPIVSAEYYGVLREFFDLLVKAETDKVVLKKV